MANEPNRLFTISEMQKVFPCCAELSNQRVSALVRQLVNDGKVERLEEKRNRRGTYGGGEFGGAGASSLFLESPDEYTLVKDTRSNFEMGDAEKVLDGQIKPFIESILKIQ